MNTTSKTDEHNNGSNASDPHPISGQGHVSVDIEAQRAKAALIFREGLAPGLVLEMDLKQIVASTRSRFQQIDVLKTYFGKTLVTDGKTQSAQFDEFAYHESLVHPAMLNFCHRNQHSGPKRVFIGGGGELATAREILRHSSVEKCVMVDIDEKVVEVSLQHLQEWGGISVKKDPRFELVIGDAYAYLMNLPNNEKFDVIVMDISDPIEAGPGIMLYTKELYQHLVTCLSPNGVFVTQAGAADAVPPPHAFSGNERDTVCFGPIRNTVQEVFSCVAPYSHCVPSYGSDWGFVMAFNQEDQTEAKNAVAEWIAMSPNVIDQLIENHIEGGEASLKAYDGITHIRMFSLTKAVRRHMAQDQRIMTKDNPIYMY